MVPSLLHAFVVCLGLQNQKTCLVGVLQQLPKLSEFRVDSKCFCCTADHCLPETGELLPCDRRLVLNTLRHWYGMDAGDSYLDEFDDLVRQRLTSIVLKQIGRTYFRYAFYMLCAGATAIGPL